MIKTELDRVCECSICPYIINPLLPRYEGGKILFDKNSKMIFTKEIEEDREVIDAIYRGDLILDYLPKHFEIAIDQRCNLYCSSCRTERITRITPYEEELSGLCRKILNEAGKGLRVLSLLGSGEVFFSPFCIELLQNLDRARFPLLKVDIMTNGQLANKATWQKIGRGADFIKSVNVSIDAATKTTYEELRRGGIWERLLDNLAFLKDLRGRGTLDSLSFNFVISERNFLEMPDFVRLAEEYNADTVLFTGLLPWHSMDLEYKKTAVHQPGHKLHGDYARILADPALKSSRVTLGA
jgi:MoaA/NifB/PqqE/SkfB family radical SAM enzyme